MDKSQLQVAYKTLTLAFKTHINECEGFRKIFRVNGYLERARVDIFLFNYGLSFRQKTNNATLDYTTL